MPGSGLAAEAAATDRLTSTGRMGPDGSPSRPGLPGPVPVTRIDATPNRRDSDPPLVGGARPAPAPLQYFKWRVIRLSVLQRDLVIRVAT
jgi:hypothetical protein